MTTSSTELARSLLLALVEAGVREVVLSPGSRNAPLAFAAYDAAAVGLVRLHTRLDERTAGFLALGLTKVGSRAAVVCTSGTAVANLHPAVLEAAHAGVPLVVLTADRPPRLRGTSANQTTDQVGIFGALVATVDLSSGEPPAALAGAGALDAAGPVHLNVPLDEPLVPPDRWVPSVAIGHKLQPEPAFTRRLVQLGRDPRPTVVVAGDDAGPPARVLAQQAGWPLLAEPTAGCRTGDHALRCYRLLLDGELGQRIERVLVFGHPTLSRPATRLLNRDDVEVWATPSVEGARPFRVARELDAAVEYTVDEPADPAWLEEWRAADRSLGRRLDALLAAEPGLTPHEVAGAVSRAVPPRGLLLVGASSPIRDLDLMVAPYAVGDRRKVIANRGLSGIDGTVSTAIGAALGRPQSSRAFALMGDVTFVHDATGLMLGSREERPDLTIVVVNDDGGSIFAMLEQGAPEYADRYDALFGLPHGTDLASLCAATRTPHWRVDGLAELEHALASPVGGIEVVEAVVRRDNRRELDERIRALRP
ncbi:MAG: 2-succinyl-5-enolpyruvyl-6-hydroxy-3-cyclohexene-1-carboxylic-acid synthase [Nocardioidaceae bacterium]